MTFDEYAQLAMRTNGTESVNEALLNATLGLCGESGEFADHIKKASFHGHELDIKALGKELGDILWYVAQACHGLGLSMDVVAEANIEKLRKRYPEGFSSEASINRAE